MNKEYVYKDGKALLIDENDNQQVIDYYDNLDEVLSVECLIEEMEEHEKELEKEFSELEKSLKFSKIIKVLRILFLIVIIGIIASLSLPVGKNLYVLGSVEKVLIAFGISFFTVPGILLSIVSYIQEIEDLKNYNGKKMQLDNLRKELVKQKEYLAELKKDKVNSKKTDEFYLKKVNDKEKLKYLRELLSFYYNLGYDEERYFRYYQKGKLDDKLDFDSEDSKKVVEEYFEEKVNGLKRTRKPKGNNRR